MRRAFLLCLTLAAALEGKADIGMASRELNPKLSTRLGGAAIDDACKLYTNGYSA